MLVRVEGVEEGRGRVEEGRVECVGGSGGCFRGLSCFGFSGCEINFARKSKIYRKNPKKPKTAKNTKKPVPGGFSGPDRPGRYEVDFSARRWGPPQKPPSFIQKTGPRTCGIVAGLVIVKEY